MGYVPSKALEEVLAHAPVGLWMEALQDSRHALVCKAPDVAIRSMFRGAGCTLLLGVVRVRGAEILCLGLTIQDEAEHPFTAVKPWMGSRDVDNPRIELDLLKEMLATGSTTLHCLNELNHPILSAWASFDADGARAALARLNAAEVYVMRSSGPLPPISRSQPMGFEGVLRLPIEATDLFQRAIYATPDSSDFDPARVPSRISLSLDIWKPQEVFQVSPTAQGGPFTVDDLDEGGKQEQAAALLIDEVYPGRTFRSPKVADGPRHRELVDVFGVDDSSLCLVESKTVAVLETELARSTKRRTAIVTKHIKKGMNQLRGAVSRIRDGHILLTAEGEAISISDRKATIAHAIVLLSDMYAFVDWRVIAEEVRKASEDDRRRALFHVFDVLELSQLVALAGPQGFNRVLFQRWLAVQQKGTAYMRAAAPFPDGKA